jgi:hypothetical protein
MQFESTSELRTTAQPKVNWMKLAANGVAYRQKPHKGVLRLSDGVGGGSGAICSAR